MAEGSRYAQADGTRRRADTHTRPGFRAIRSRVGTGIRADAGIGTRTRADTDTGTSGSSRWGAS